MGREERAKRAREGRGSETGASSDQGEDDVPYGADEGVDEGADAPDAGWSDEREELLLMSDDEEVENAALAAIWAEVDHG